VRTAISIARALDAVLYAIDVQESAQRFTPSSGGATPRIQDPYFTLSKAGGLPDDVDVRIVVTEGEPGTELVRLANRRTDLLVVGSRVWQKGPTERGEPGCTGLRRQCRLRRRRSPPESRPGGDAEPEVKEYAASSGMM
jgi:nucleotide-binding universal stress UspA family protein